MFILFRKLVIKSANYKLLFASAKHDIPRKHIDSGTLPCFVRRGDSLKTAARGRDMQIFAGRRGRIVVAENRAGASARTPAYV